uniref:DDE Tnp4 domain-containing protein n=1 Tax=Stomoxys calcitrans TaxID=35570 RepID=A0A1I8NRK4_STOCA
MDVSVAVYFLEDTEADISRRQLRDMTNVLEMPTNEFVKKFRVSKEIFTMLLETLRNKWEPMHRRTYIRPDIKLATFLRFLVSGSYQQTVGNEVVSSTSKTSVGRILRECLTLFDEWICNKWIKPPTAEEQQQTIDAFLDKTGFPGVIGCVDGTHIRIKGPGENMKHLYYNGMGYYSINVMVICDQNMNITYVEGTHPGSSNDSSVWEASEVSQKIQQEFEQGKRNFWVLGDADYKLKPYLMTPFSKPSDTAEVLYNKKHASTHNVVKRCLKLLTNKFECLIGIRGLHYPPDRANQIIGSCCALHNMCIKYKCLDVLESSCTSPEIPISKNKADENEVKEDITAAAIRRRIAINL